MFAVSSAAQQNPPLAAPPSPAAAPAAADTGNKPSSGYITVMRVTGEAYVFQTGDTLRFALRVGSLVSAGQQIVTGPKANVMLAFSNGATVTIGENAIVAVDEFTQTPFSEMFKMAEATKEPSISKTRLNLVRGEILSNVKKLNTAEGSSFEVKTPIGVAGIRGTTFSLSYFPPPPKGDENAIQRAARPPAFGLVMLEGTIAMQVNGRSQPIIVPQGKELVLDDSGIDPDTGGMSTAIANSLAPAATPIATQAVLLQGAQTMMAAAGGITMPSSAALSGMGGVMPANMLAPAPNADSNAKRPAPDASGRHPAPPADDNKSGGSQPVVPAPAGADNIFPAPPAQNPAPRLSPTDGTGK